MCTHEKRELFYDWRGPCRFSIINGPVKPPIEDKDTVVSAEFVRSSEITNYTLSADIKYNLKSEVIKSVANRYFGITGVTIAFKAENKRTI